MEAQVFSKIGRGRGKTVPPKTQPAQPSFDSNDVSLANLSISDNKENKFSNVSEPTENGSVSRSQPPKPATDDELAEINVPPPRVSYIPNDDAEEYHLHVNSGINFDNYDSVHVQVTGKDIPPSISSIDDFQIPDFLQSNIQSSNYKKLTPVQKYTIPIIGCGRDIMACAQTGSGKTVAFLVPIIKNISEKPDEVVNAVGGNCPKCLIMVPTRELCRQIYTVAVKLCRDSPIKCGYSYGGVEMRTSMMKLHKCDILVSTPGRLTFNLDAGHLSLSRLRYLVLDEADRMLQNEAFFESIKRIYECREKGGSQFHVSMFSATFPREMQLLGESLMVDHLFVAVGLVGSASTDIKQRIINVTAGNKLDVALKYLQENDTGKTLIFVRAKRFADFLGIRLIDLQFTATTIHGDRDQCARELALNDFKSGRVTMLVATDVASRGLDIPQVDTVVNVDMPDEPEVYVHRIGRTGRCGNPGLSVSFFDEVQDMAMAPRLAQVLKDANQECPAWLKALCGGYNQGRNPQDFPGRRNGGHSRDYRRNVETSTFVENRFMNASRDDKEDDFFS